MRARAGSFECVFHIPIPIITCVARHQSTPMCSHGNFLNWPLMSGSWNEWNLSPTIRRSGGDDDRDVGWYRGHPPLRRGTFGNTAERSPDGLDLDAKEPRRIHRVGCCVFRPLGPRAQIGRFQSFDRTSFERPLLRHFRLSTFQLSTESVERIVLAYSGKSTVRVTL